MKYSNYLGVAAAIAVVAVCFIPWVYIPSVNATVTGYDPGTTRFGRPGLVNIFLCFFAVIFFIVPKVWAKRSNMLLSAINFAWAIRNFFVVTRCEMGECPEKKAGIYALLILSFLVLLMSLLPKLEVRRD